MSEITLDKSEFETLHDCKVGEPLALTGKVTAIDGDTLTVDVESATYDEGADEGTPADENAPDEEAEPAMSKKPARAIIAIGIPGKSSKGY